MLRLTQPVAGGGGFGILGGDGEGLGLAGGGVLQHQLSLAALETDRARPLHLRGQLLDDLLVVVQAGQVPAVPQLGHLPAHGTGQVLELGGGHVDASEALQAEGVATSQHLGGFEDIVVGTEADAALGVLHIILWGLPPPLSSLGVFTSSTRPPLPFSLPPPPSLPPLGVRTPRSLHFYRLFLTPVFLFGVLYTLVGLGLDIGSQRRVVSPRRSACLSALIHGGG